jgi:hypothetical protein
MKSNAFLVIFASFLVCSTTFIPFSRAANNTSSDTTCNYTKDKKTAFCSCQEDDCTVYRCEKQRNKTWKCGAIPKVSLPTNLIKGAKIPIQIKE